MTVGDLQKYLRGLADAIGAATKSPAKDLLDVAERLAPFAQHEIAAFAAFLKLADEYRTTGRLPEPGKSPPKPKPAKTLAPAKPTKAQPGEVVILVDSLRSRVIADASLTREAIDSELRAFEKRLTKTQWQEAVKLTGFAKKPATIGEALQTLVNHVMARKAGVDRADA
jgi:hypothetical protein